MLQFNSATAKDITTLEQAVFLSNETELSISAPPDLEETFIEFLGLDVADGNASIDTIVNYKSQVKLYLQWCIDTATNPLMATKKDIQEYRAYLVKQNYKPATIALKINVVRRFYDGAITHGLITNNPVKNVKAPIERVAPASSVRYLELEQLKALFKLTEGKSEKLRRDRVIIGLMALHGLRTIEVVRLNFGDIREQGEKKFITVSAKRSQRILKLRSDFSLWLLDYLATKKVLTSKAPIITSLSGNSFGKRLTRSGLRRIINSYLEQAGLRDCNADGIKLSNHALRHTFATQVYASTKDLRLVQEALGHGNPQTTAKYAHVVDGVSAADCIDF
ncbi:MAG: tyrosine-type recombinase/integrase [Waterburya sp.]